MEITHVHTLTLTDVLSESKRIISSRYLHFVTLSLFFTPLSISLMFNRFPDQPYFDDNTYYYQKLIISYIFYTLTAYILALCAIGMITYTTHHAFFGQSVTISESLKSLTYSLFPLVSTAIVAYVLIVLITLSFVLVVGIVIMLVDNFVVIDYNSVYFMWFLAIMGVILLGITIYLALNWKLAFVVVVVESKWGFAALKRSSYLVKGMRSVSLLTRLYFWVFGGLIVWMCYANVHVIVATVLGLFFIMMFLLRITAANVVLYNYCKALHGELEVEVADGVGHHYMDLPSDGEKAPKVVIV